jgi:hypothetical protein
MAASIITVTAYRAMGQLHVLITQLDAGEGQRSYRKVAQVVLDPPDDGKGELAQDLMALADAAWRAGYEVAAAAF